MKLAVAALLLTFTTVITAGFVFSQFAFNVTERMKTTFPAQSLQLESYEINRTCITMRIANLASASVRITAVYINEEMYNLQETIVVSPSEVAAVYLYGVYVVGKTYFVKVFPGLGLPLVFSAEYE